MHPHSEIEVHKESVQPTQLESGVEAHKAAIAERKVAFVTELTLEQIVQQRAAARHYAKKRKQSRKYYSTRAESSIAGEDGEAKESKVTKRRTAKAKPVRQKKSAEERAASAREYARRKYRENPGASAARQKIYREKKRLSYAAFKEAEAKGLHNDFKASDSSDTESDSETESESGSEQGDEEKKE